MINQYIKIDRWKVVEDHFLADRVKASESLFSIGNGIMGQRANFEETYSGATLPGSYIGGVYYPDKTRVGWWKNGYPEYFAKVLNSAFWIGIKVTVNSEEIDLFHNKVVDFYRELNMKTGVLTRRFEVETSDGTRVAIESIRFVSLARTELGAISYSIKVLNRPAIVEMMPYINADVHNEDSNYNEKFWEPVSQSSHSVTMRTRKTGFEVCWHAENCLDREFDFSDCSLAEFVAQNAVVSLMEGESITLYKYVGVASSLNYAPDELAAAAAETAKKAAAVGFDALLVEQVRAWEEKWRHCDIEIDGDDQAQQGIRFCIFHLLQTYTGQDARLNVGPKGFTGEKYGGSTYWDTEAYCLSFYMATAGEQVAHQLLLYRYNQLDRAIENGKKLGFKNGAALYPMVTMNGEECHNEWEITFEEIHRNGAIAYAIYNYIRYTGKKEYLAEAGLEVLLSIARFWAQRITFSSQSGKYVMLGVTGPNEYENNVNNNWYTNYIACWCMNYAAECALWVKQNYPEDFYRISNSRNFDINSECEAWKKITGNMHLPQSEEYGVFLQQDGYLDKEQILVKDLDPSERPLNQKWSWDRILRSCFIKQADVLQGLYFFRENFDKETIRRNFHFYEQRTVHESSLSPCVHSILASYIGDMDKAFEMYLRTSRLDLDDYNKEIGEGLHITSMAGSWLSIIEGFGGMRMGDEVLSFQPSLPEGWTSLSFKVDFRGSVLSVKITKDDIAVTTETGAVVDVVLCGKKVKADGSKVSVNG